MTIPTTNVTFSSIQTEFGGTNPISLSEYYKSGSYVPANQSNSSIDPNPIPTSGTITIGEFRNVTKTTFQLPNRSWSESNTWVSNPTAALCWVNVYNDGTLVCFRGLSPLGESNVHVYNDYYYNPTTTGIGSGYWIYVTLNSGGLTSGSSATGTWIQLSGISTYNCVAQTTAIAQNNVQHANITIQFSTTASLIGLFATATYDMTSTVSSGE